MQRRPRRLQPALNYEPVATISRVHHSSGVDDQRRQRCRPRAVSVNVDILVSGIPPAVPVQIGERLAGVILSVVVQVFVWFGWVPQTVTIPINRQRFALEHGHSSGQHVRAARHVPCAPLIARHVRGTGRQRTEEHAEKKRGQKRHVSVSPNARRVPDTPIAGSPRLHLTTSRSWEYARP